LEAFLRVSRGKITKKRGTPTSYVIPKKKIPQRNTSKSFSRKSQERALKITKKRKRERHNQTLRNHVESSIPTMKVHTSSSLPPDHPSLSQDLTMKLSS
jgi:hypothetical protein